MRTNDDKTKSVYSIRTYSVLCLFLLPLFFVLHHYSFHYPWFATSDAAKLTGIYFIAGIIISVIFLYVLKDTAKAGLAALLIIAFELSAALLYPRIRAKGILRGDPGEAIFYAAGILLLAGMLWAMKRSAFPARRFLSFAVLLFAVLNAYELVSLYTRAQKIEKAVNTMPSLTSHKTPGAPDICLIVLDGYPGDKTLGEIFNYDNKDFFDSLRKRNFRVLRNTNSNYDVTWFSMASMFGQEYLPAKYSDQRMAQTISMLKVRDAPLWSLLKNEGYKIHNWSHFAIDTLAPIGKVLGRISNRSDQVKMFTGRTFTGRAKELWKRSFDASFKKEKEHWEAYHTYHFNINVLEKLYKYATNVNEKDFVYAHLIMPHPPYYLNEAGDPVNSTDLGRKEAFLPYMRYTNRRVIEITDRILEHNPNTVISILADHGAREYSSEYFFSNLITIYLPDKDHGTWYDTITNVNHFRLLLNKVFNQRLPPLRDSIAAPAYGITQ